jgi:glycosyltransferase involved in cell wall biosynthesis
MSSAELTIEESNFRGISVIICCYNSAARLPKTLSHLAQQIVSVHLNWELIIVDNASTDQTAQTAKEIWKDLNQEPGILKVLREERPGQQYARLKGVKESLYDLTVFCDDDNWLAPDYLSLASEIMQNDETIGASGGFNKPATDANGFPDWFDSYSDKYALSIPGTATGDVSNRGFVLGAGMITRKKLFLEMYQDKYPSLLKGRKGESLSTGDDFEYCKRLLLRGYRLYFSERMILTHFIAKERLTIIYRDRLMQGIENAGLVLHEYDLAIRVLNRFRNKNRIRLLLLTPFRILFVRLGLMNRVLIDEELTLYYLSPFDRTKNPIRKKIKAFICRKQIPE